MSETCPVVKIKAENEQGFVIINESDFDSEKHELLGVEKSEQQVPATPVAIETPDNPFAKKPGGKK